MNILNQMQQWWSPSTSNQLIAKKEEILCGVCHRDANEILTEEPEKPFFGHTYQESDGSKHPHLLCELCYSALKKQSHIKRSYVTCIENCVHCTKAPKEGNWIQKFQVLNSKEDLSSAIISEPINLPVDPPIGNLPTANLRINTVDKTLYQVSLFILSQIAAGLLTREVTSITDVEAMAAISAKNTILNGAGHVFGRLYYPIDVDNSLFTSLIQGACTVGAIALKASSTQGIMLKQGIPISYSQALIFEGATVAVEATAQAAIGYFKGPNR